MTAISVMSMMPTLMRKGLLPLLAALAALSAPAHAQYQQPYPAAPTYQAPASQAPAQPAPQYSTPGTTTASEYSVQEIVDAGHNFFGSTSGGIAKTIESAFESYGLPNGYILGEEASGAFIGGLTYGEGRLYTKNVGDHQLFWQGPSLGLDYGGQGARTMMLVYNLPSVDGVYGRFAGVSGSAFIVAGVGMQVMRRDTVLVVPIRTGVGARLGLNIGYLKLTPMPTWNPF